MANKKPLRILCFGDSLTSGFPPAHPYAGKLEEQLEAAFPSLDVQCDVEGMPGDRVAKGQYQLRLFEAWRLADEPYDWTIILGGTNDIGWGEPPDVVIEALKQAWNMSLSRGSKVLALTIPECRAKSEKLEGNRNAINRAIKEYRKRNYFHFDLFAALPYHKMPAADRPRYWNMDGLHLTEAGYDLMGERIAEGLVRIIRLAEAQDTEISSVVTDARQRRAIEELIFEEERGDHRLLSQGYIIVRKSDLD